MDGLPLRAEPSARAKYVIASAKRNCVQGNQAGRT